MDHRLQGRRPRPPGQPERARPHAPLRDLAAAIAKLSARTLVLDGEVAIIDQQLRSRFDWLREPEPDVVATPPILIAFDIMYRERRDLAGLPMSARRIHLEDVVADADLVLPVRRLAANGFDAWAQVVGINYEGLVAQGRGQRVRGRASSPAVDTKLKRRGGLPWAQCQVKTPPQADDARRVDGPIPQAGNRGRRAGSKVRGSWPMEAWGSSGAEANLIAGIVQALKGGGDAAVRYGSVRLRPSEEHHD